MVWQNLLDTFIMIKDAFVWFIIAEALFFTTLMTWTIFMAVYIFFVELPGMAFNFLIGWIELMIAKLQAKRIGVLPPRNDGEVHLMTKADPFTKMIREIRILINKWALLVQNGTGVMLFAMIWGNILLFTIYALSQGMSISGANDGTILDLALDLLDLLPYAMMGMMVLTFGWLCYTIIVSAYKAFEYIVLRDSVFRQDPVYEVRDLWNNRKILRDK